jgi:hypothetical protein
VTAPDPGRVLRRALIAWGLGHLAIGRTAIGRALLMAEAVAIALVAWLTIGLADSSAYLVPFLAGAAFIVAWGWQAVDAYRSARRLQPAHPVAPERSPAAVIGWLALPLVVWGTGFWLIGASSASPEAVLDRFVSDWSRGTLDDSWPSEVRGAATTAAASLGTGPEAFAEVRVRVADADAAVATALAESVHFERQPSRVLLVFEGSRLVPVADDLVLTLDLAARPVELPGGGDIGAVRWELVSADAP